jgi:hypothetical protein
MCLTTRNNDSSNYTSTDVEHLAQRLLTHPCLARVGAPSSNTRVKAVEHPASGLRITITLDSDDSILHCVIAGGYGVTTTESKSVCLTLANGTRLIGAIHSARGRRMLHFKFQATRAGETALLGLAKEAVVHTAHSHSVFVVETACMLAAQ